MGHQKIKTVLIKGVAQALSGMTNSFCHFYRIFCGMALPEAALNNPKYRPNAFWHKMADGPNLRVRVFLECDEKGHLRKGPKSYYNEK